MLSGNMRYAQDNYEELLCRPIREHMRCKHDAVVFFHCVSGQARSAVSLGGTWGLRVGGGCSSSGDRPFGAWVAVGVPSVWGSLAN